MLKSFKITFISFIAYVLYRVWVSTWRMRVYEPPALKEDLQKKNSLIFAFWHGEILGIVPFCRFYPVVSMASVSSDGQIITNVIEKLGIKVARGSSSKKGAQGLKQILRISKEGLIPVLPVDGPRGPAFIPKPGVFELSKILNAKIYAGRIICEKKLTFKSWDQAFFPLPFSKVLLYWQEALPPLLADQDPRDEKLCSSLAASLNATGQSGLKEFAKII